MFNNEIDLLNIRLNILNKYVDYFVKQKVPKHILVLKKLCFDLEKFPEFKNKIIYGVIKKFPLNLNAWEKENTKETLFQNF